MAALPDCPRCDAAQSLKPTRSDTNGHKWCYCECCSATVLVDKHGRVLKASVR